ncbi:MAG: hypothetical protein Ta2A_09260 [Treponemataceae bacterium]|nr:MAG: hypothetical protein Ta2A_09260 [Treponemataceae bacterium]
MTKKASLVITSVFLFAVFVFVLGGCKSFFGSLSPSEDGNIRSFSVPGQIFCEIKDAPESEQEEQFAKVRIIKAVIPRPSPANSGMLSSIIPSVKAAKTVRVIPNEDDYMEDAFGESGSDAFDLIMDGVPFVQPAFNKPIDFRYSETSPVIFYTVSALGTIYKYKVTVIASKAVFIDAASTLDVSTVSAADYDYEVGSTWETAVKSFKDAQTLIASPLHSSTYQIKAYYVAGGNYDITAEAKIKDSVTVYGGFKRENDPSLRNPANPKTLVISEMFYDVLVDDDGSTPYASIGLDNVTFEVTGCSALYLRSTVLTTATKFSVNNCTFINHGDRDTAAIILFGSEVKAQITNSIFINITAMGKETRERLDIAASITAIP